MHGVIKLQGEAGHEIYLISRSLPSSLKKLKGIAEKQKISRVLKEC